MKRVGESVMVKHIFEFTFSSQPVTWAAAFLVPHKLIEEEGEQLRLSLQEDFVCIRSEIKNCNLLCNTKKHLETFI